MCPSWYPGPQGIVFDLPDAIEGAQRAIVARGLYRAS